MKKQDLTLKALMQQQKFFHTGLQRIIEKHMIFLHVTAYYLIMNPQDEERLL